MSAAGNFNLHCHSTRLPRLPKVIFISPKEIRLILLDFDKNVSDRRIGFNFRPHDVKVLSRWQMKSFSTWHFKISKTLQVCQADVATWNHALLIVFYSRDRPGRYYLVDKAYIVATQLTRTLLFQNQQRVPAVALCFEGFQKIIVLC